MTESSHAVFLSYASQDQEAAQRICEALRAASLEVWFDQSALRGGDVWDQTIRKQIKTCVAFIPVISRHTHDRDEGYFRLEWKLAVDRSHLMTADKAFLLPVVIDDTREDDERVPDKFRDVQWTRLPGGETPSAFVERVRRLVSQGGPSHDPVDAVSPAASVSSATASTRQQRVTGSWGLRRPLLATIAVVVSAPLVYYAIDRYWASRRTTSTPAPLAAPASAPVAAFNPPPHSIAVLPFVNMSADKDQEYFSDGLTEELIDHLARASDLKVIARTSSFQFKGRNEDVRTIATKLTVANLLEGSVRRSGKMLRITAQLVRASDGLHIWSHTYDRAIDDVFKVQNDIAEMVTRALHVALTQTTLSAADQPNVNAYNAVLKGDFFKARLSKQDLDRAISLYNEALQIDPQYALAWARLGSAYMNQALGRFVPVTEGFARARNALERAVALDPNLIWAHYTMSGLYMNQLDWAGGAAELKRMREIDPNDKYLLPAAEADVYSIWCRFPDAIRLTQQTLDRDPLNTYSWDSLASLQFNAGQLEASLDSYRRLIELSPGQAGAQASLGLVLALAGRPAEGLAAIQKESDELTRLENLPIAYWAKGDRTLSDSALRDLVAQHGSEAPYAVAQAYAYRGQLKEALDWLDRAVKEPDPAVAFVRCDPLLRSVRSEPRYHALLERLHLNEVPQIP